MTWRSCHRIPLADAGVFSENSGMPFLAHLYREYRTPRFSYGSVVMDDVRGWVTIVGTTDGPIPWPIGKRGRAKSPVVYGALTRAIRTEPAMAVAREWGLTAQTITKWRKALDVPRMNEGSMRWCRERATLPTFAEFARKGQAKNRDPARCAKIAAAKRGVPRPPEVIEAMRRANLARRLSAAHRQKLSEANHRLGRRPPKAGRTWTKAEDALLRRLPTIEVARRTGRTVSAVWCRRQLLGMPDGRRTR
jgi:hypothetical protein